MKTVSRVVFMIFVSITFVRAGTAPVCGDSCRGGTQTPGTGGAFIQTETAVTNQRGVGGSGVTIHPVGKSTNIVGSQSFTYSLPLFEIPGRGINLNLGLYYNSLVWEFNSDNRSMVYAADFQLSPGFTLGYGMLNFSDDLSVGILTEPTGSRHLLVPSATTANQFRTTDSTYILVQYPSTVGGAVVATFKDGMRAFYQPFTVLATNRTEYRPYQIEDANGNIISIAYTNPNNLNISTITDTVGRVIQFIYDATGTMLQSVGQLGGNGQVFRQYNFSWQQGAPLTFSFNRRASAGLGLPPGFFTSGQSTVNLLTKVTKLDGTSVNFDYGFGSGGNPDWGTVKTITELSSSGATRYSTSYLFPRASAGILTTNPTYTTQTVFDGINSSTWTYQATTNASGLVTSFVVTDPCGTAKTTTISAAGDALDGLPIAEQITTTQPPPGVLVFQGCPTAGPNTQIWGTANTSWTTDADGSNPRLLSITRVLDDGTTQSEVKCNSYDAFGQVTDLLEYDFGANGPGALLRETVTTYATAINNILNRPSRVVVKDGSGNTFSRIDLNYDEAPVTDLPNPVGHDPAYTSVITTRGNLTSEISYANAAAGTGGVTSRFTYDAAGNRLTSQEGCCRLKTQTFSSTTQYAYPDSVLTGPSGNSLSLTTALTYNLATGTVASAKDENGQLTTYSYDLAGRLTATLFPDNSTVSQSYDDSGASRAATVSNSLNNLVEVSTADGRGRVISQEVKNGAALVSTKTISYDPLGRLMSVSNPFGPSETPVYTAYQFDPLDRITQTTPPGNTGSNQTTYLAQTITTTDSAGKQHKRYMDAFGRVRQVDEPGQSGGAPGFGSVSISGIDQSVSVPSGGNATAGTGSVTLSGTERSTVVLTHAATAASVTITIGGSDGTNVFSSTACVGGPPSRLPLKCHTTTVNSLDAGTMHFSVNAGGSTIGPVSVSYGSTSTPASLAAALYSSFPANSLVSISNPNGSASFTLTTTPVGSSTNSSIISAAVTSNCVPSDSDSSSQTCSQGWTISPTQANFSGGTDNVNTTFYDTGTVSVNLTINGTVYSKSSSYGQTTTGASIVSDLANKINSDTVLNKLIVANPSGGVLGLTTAATGTNTAYPLSASSVTNSQNFTSGTTSFAATGSGTTMTPGQNGVVFDAGTVSVTVAGFTTNPYVKTVNYSQGSTPASLASSIAGAFNSDPLSPVSATGSGGVVSLTAITSGADTNYTVTVTSTTTQNAYFAQPSFTGSAIPLSGGQDPTASLGTPLSTAYSYDPLGHLVLITQGAQQRAYQYDGLGQLIAAKIPETQNLATSYTYTDFGSVLQKTDPRGIVTTNSYDALARLSQVAYSDGTPTITYSYGAAGAPNFGAGRITSVVDGSGTETLQYDSMARTKQVARVVAGQTYTTSYAYTAGQLSSIAYPSGRTVNITPDAIGRLSQIGSNNSNILTIGSYNAAGEILGATYGNGMTANYTYNSRLELATLVSGSTTTPMLNLTYNYGSQNNGQIQGITDGVTPSQSSSYTYDELGRLRVAQTNDLTAANTWKLKFSYDRYGNRLSEIPEAGTATMPFNEVLVDPTTNRITALQYDAAGNVTNDGLHSYAYDAENKITHVDGAGSFVYDAGGLRVKKNGTLYIYDGSHVIAEYPIGVASASPSVEYLYGNGKLLASFASGVTTYYYSDHLSIRALADASGTVVGRQSQYPYGELVSGLQTGTTTKWDFTNYERDLAVGDSGLDNAKARYYANRFGRFMSIDPFSGSLTNPQSLNKFSYASGDPVNFVDPNGMLITRVCMLREDGSESNFCVGSGAFIDGQFTLVTGNLLQGDFFAACPNNACSRSEWVNDPDDPNGGHWHNQEFFAFANGGTGYYSIGGGPGGLFYSFLQAGTAAINYINSQSVQENREYAGEIYLDQNGIYSYDDPRPGDFQSSLVEPDAVPDGTVFVGDYHTHGADSNGVFDDEHYSPQDENLTFQRMLDYSGYIGAFLGTPGGRTELFNGVCTVLSGPALAGCP
jgi:RHS repeat-associated protein